MKSCKAADAPYDFAGLHAAHAAPKQAAGARVRATLTIHKARQTLAMSVGADGDSRGPRGPNKSIHTNVSRKHEHVHRPGDAQLVLIA